MSEGASVLVTGANGFVGHHLLDSLQRRGFDNAVGAYRRQPSGKHDGATVVGDIDAATDWSKTLKTTEVVIHTAARAHVMAEECPDPLAEYRRVNVEGTLNLAQQAANAGASRFIFISSIKVNGEQTPLNQPFTAEDEPAPEDAYGISKLEAEQGLKKLAQETGMEVVIIRPPLVYGPGVKGNFATMIKLVEKGWPLPLGSISNKRSLVALDNLIDLIVACIDHPAAANQVFLAGDGQDLSTTELLRGVAKAMGKQSRLFPFPEGLLRFGAIVLGKQAMADRLLGSLRVDIAKSRALIGWEPPLTVETGLKRCFGAEHTS